MPSDPGATEIGDLGVEVCRCNWLFSATPYSQQATQYYALKASFLRIITTPAIPRLSNNQVPGAGTVRLG